MILISDAETAGSGINIIYNGFWPATKLGDLSQPDDYISQSIQATSKLLNSIKSKNINKFIYTSSASVYGNYSFCEEASECMPLSLHASLKVANEKLVSLFCQQNDIPFAIVRLFNMYGGEDKFSVIAKILNAAKGESELNVLNGGKAIRDFIYIEDVVAAYLKILTSDFSGVINVASGFKTSVAEVMDKLQAENFPIKSHSLQRDEIQCSVASVEKLSKLVDMSTFTRVEDYLLAELRKPPVSNVY